MIGITNNFTFMMRLRLRGVTELEDLLHFALILNTNDFTSLRRDKYRDRYLNFVIRIKV
jgi:hypothetical protein